MQLTIPSSLAISLAGFPSLYPDMGSKIIFMHEQLVQRTMDETTSQIDGGMRPFSVRARASADTIARFEDEDAMPARGERARSHGAGPARPDDNTVVHGRHR